MESAGGWEAIRVADCYDHQTIDSREVVRIARVEGQSVRERDRRNHGVVGPCANLPARTAKRCGHLPERSSCIGVEGKGVEVGLGLLEMRKPSSSLGLVRRDERPDRKLRECDG